MSTDIAEPTSVSPESTSPEKRPSEADPQDSEDAQQAKRARLESPTTEPEEGTGAEREPRPASSTEKPPEVDVTKLKGAELLAKMGVQRTEVSPLILMKANLAALPLTLRAHESLPIRVQFAINSIPLLDNVATQILRLIGVGPYEETLAIITNEDPTPEGLVYRDLVELFEQTKRIYSEEDPFLDLKHIVEDTSIMDEECVKHLREVEDDVDSALRKANLATFLLATLGSIEVGFFFLNEFFLDVFCPSSSTSWFRGSAQRPVMVSPVVPGKLLKAQAVLFLELKTQAYISALESGNRTKEEILDDIFPANLEQILLERRHSTQLTPAENDFILRCKSRRESLLSTPDDEDLSENYDWLIFLKELFSYVSKNIGSLLWGRKGRSAFLSRFTDAIGKALGSTMTKEEILKRLEEKKREEEERERKREEEAARNPLTPTGRPSKKGTSVTKPKAPPKRGDAQGPPRLRNIMRRPWTTEEENALVEALKKYGPHWSEILEYYGPGGTMSEALKGRTQVQLKDKARNWKMSYLKNGNPVPDYLKGVTGELDRDEKVYNARRKQRQKKNLPGKRPATKAKETEKEKEGEKSNNDTAASKEATPVETSSEKVVEATV